MLSVVVPCYNEEENIPLIVSKFEKILSESGEDIEVIFVNNGSHDNSKTIFEKKTVNTTQKIKVLNIEKNIGYGHGILSGLKIAKGEVLGWTHADLQTEPSDVLSALNKYNKHNDPDLIIKGRRKNRNIIDSFFTWGMQIYCYAVLKDRLNDINAQPKMFGRNFYEAHFSAAPNDFSLDLFLLYKAQKIKTIDVFFRKRKFGKSKGGGTLIGKWKLIKRTICYINKLKNEITK
ncbi:glycosyltransferase family 2 protein [Flavobacteriales bacterium]|nr:glycosyltransferase family 2 protein [Flavobacteriales bacterium]